jgi:hypothetical protein
MQETVVINSGGKAMSNNPRDLVEDPRTDTHSARSMPDAANADASIQGYAAVNGLDGDSEVARRAYELYLRRQQTGEDGSADSDWFRAENEVRRTRDSGNAG